MSRILPHFVILMTTIGTFSVVSSVFSTTSGSDLKVGSWSLVVSILPLLARCWFFLEITVPFSS